jgi:redox-sensitive bicupin YhaK (pirin superfamily)
MMIVRRSRDRGCSRYHWLDSRHTFSFAGYFDPDYTGFSSLRVLNEDRVAPSGGFPFHPHQDMEIISYVLDGTLKHRDSRGNTTLISAGGVQRMSAGTGIIHSEYNASDIEPVHFLQIWIEPAVLGIQPDYKQKTFGQEEKQGHLCLIVSPDGRSGSLYIRQDAYLYATVLMEGDGIQYPLAPGRKAFAQIARGAVTSNGIRLAAGDGAAIQDEEAIGLTALEPSEILLFDLA